MQSWDYIVIGAGSAGCAVARRLSDDPANSVLLLEAGGPADNFWIGVPAGMARVIGNRRFDWCFVSEPNAALNNRTMPMPRGMTLGGSSAINGMVYTRGNRRDYDGWAALGNPGWSWDEVLPYFKKLEDNERGASTMRGAGGPQKISDARPRAKAVDAFIEAAKRVGIAAADDLSVSGEEGVGHLQATVYKGKRCSAYAAYIAPVKGRRNLTILSGKRVVRIILDGKKAVGVEVLEDGVRQQFRCNNEVILSAGATNSPHILMLSGIGNGTHLQDVGVEPIHHLPGVGQNLQDHCGVHLKVESKPGWSYNARVNGWRKYVEGARWLFLKSGYLTAGATLAAAFTRSGPDIPYADLEIGFRPITFTYSSTSGVSVDAMPAVSSNVYRVRPDSRGEIRLGSADPLKPAIFHTNYMSADEDVRATLSGIHQMRRILSQDPIAKAIRRELQPGTALQSDSQLFDYIRANAKSAYHCVGTCKMGMDEMSVVDARLRIRGISGLRVVDASIMPTPSSGNTNAASIMIGEKGADMVLQDRQVQGRHPAAAGE